MGAEGTVRVTPVQDHHMPAPLIPTSGGSNTRSYFDLSPGEYLEQLSGRIHVPGMVTLDQWAALSSDDAYATAHQVSQQQPRFFSRVPSPAPSVGSITSTRARVSARAEYLHRLLVDEIRQFEVIDHPAGSTSRRGHSSSVPLSPPPPADDGLGDDLPHSLPLRRDLPPVAPHPALPATSEFSVLGRQTSTTHQDAPPSPGMQDLEEAVTKLRREMAQQALEAYERERRLVDMLEEVRDDVVFRQRQLLRDEMAEFTRQQQQQMLDLARAVPPAAPFIVSPLVEYSALARPAVSSWASTPLSAPFVLLPVSQHAPMQQPVASAKPRVVSFTDTTVVTSSRVIMTPREGNRAVHNSLGQPTTTTARGEATLCTLAGATSTLGYQASSGFESARMGVLTQATSIPGTSRRVRARCQPFTKSA